MYMKFLYFISVSFIHSIDFMHLDTKKIEQEKISCPTLNFTPVMVYPLEYLELAHNDLSKPR